MLSNFAVKLLTSDAAAGGVGAEDGDDPALGEGLVVPGADSGDAVDPCARTPAGSGGGAPSKAGTERGTNRDSSADGSSP